MLLRRWSILPCVLVGAGLLVAPVAALAQAKKKPAAATKPSPAALRSELKRTAPKVQLGAPKAALIPKSGRKPSVVKLPPNAAPVVALTSRREWEVALARFVMALQRDQRSRAARLFSSRVSAQDRRAFQQRRWLDRRQNGRNEFNQVLFFPDLQIRTSRLVPNAIRPTGVTCILIPRTRLPKKTGKMTGLLEVPLRLEGTQWRVVLHQKRVARR